MYLSASFLVKIKKMLLSIFIVIFALLSVCLVFVLGLMALVYLNVYCHVEFAKPNYPVSLEKILPLNEIEIIDSGYSFYAAANNHGLYFLIKFKDKNGFDDFIEKIPFNYKFEEPAKKYHEALTIINENNKYLDLESIIYDNYRILADYANKEHQAKYDVRMIRSSDKQYLYMEMESWN